MRPGRLDPEQERCARAGLERALAEGSAILARRESALDAVASEIGTALGSGCRFVAMAMSAPFLNDAGTIAEFRIF